MATAFRWLVPVVIAFGVWVFTTLSPLLGLSFFVAIIPMVGLLRRELIPLVGFSGNDPTTLLSAMIVGGLVLRLIVARQIKIDTLPSKLMLCLMFIMGVQIFNPAQGGLMVGVAGALFYFVPILYFFVGRAYCNNALLERICTLVFVVGTLCAGYGLYQNSFGFNEREWAWIEDARYNQQLLGVYRVFSTFLSFGEYVLFVSFAFQVAWSRLIRRHWIYLPFVVLLGLTIFVSSSRGGVISNLVAAVVSLSILDQNRNVWVRRAIILGAAVAWGLLLILGRVEVGSADDRNAFLVGHQVAGLTDPLGDKSTGKMHMGLAVFGLVSGLRQPAGIGLGATTSAMEKFGGQKDVHTELDITNFFVSTGIVGGPLYAVLVAILIGKTLRYWSMTRQTVALSIVGIALAAFGNWTTGGYYSTSAVIWLLVGGVDLFLSRQIPIPARIDGNPASTGTSQSFAVGSRG